MYEFDKTTDNSILMLKFQQKYLIGKLYKKNDLEKNNSAQLVKKEIEVTQIVTHPFLPIFYQIIENDKIILKISEFIQGESLYDSIR